MSALGISGGLLLSQIVNFILLVVILRTFLYEPILNMLEQRKEKIAQGLREAERVSAAAQEAEQEDRKVHRVWKERGTRENTKK